MNNKGVIYILTNPSFPEYVKIGYADDLKQRLSQLNRSECIPFAFRIYATYKVDSRLSDKKIHSIIDRINPDLRSIENFNGRKRVREFYAMTPEDAYGILEAIAEIHGYADRLKKYQMTESEKRDEQLAQELDNENTERASNFSFSAWTTEPLYGMIGKTILRRSDLFDTGTNIGCLCYKWANINLFDLCWFGTGAILSFKRRFCLACHCGIGCV